MDCYVWNEHSGRSKGEEPVRENNHGADAMRYLVWGLDCEQAPASAEGPVDYDVVEV